MSEFDLLKELLDRLDDPQDWEFENLGEIEEYDDMDGSEPHMHAYVSECSYLGDTNFMVASNATGEEGLQAWFIQEACQKVPRAIKQQEALDEIRELYEQWYIVTQADRQLALRYMHKVGKIIKELGNE